MNKEEFMKIFTREENIPVYSTLPSMFTNKTSEFSLDESIKTEKPIKKEESIKDHNNFLKDNFMKNNDIKPVPCMDLRPNVYEQSAHNKILEEKFEVKPFTKEKFLEMINKSPLEGYIDYIDQEYYNPEININDKLTKGNLSNKLRLKMIEYKLEEVDFKKICLNPTINIEFIEKFKDKIDWDTLIYNSKCEENNYELIRIYKDNFNFDILCKTIRKVDEFINEFNDKINWKTLSENVFLTEQDILKYEDKLDWNILSENVITRLSKEFIEQNIDKITINKKNESKILLYLSDNEHTTTFINEQFENTNRNITSKEINHKDTIFAQPPIPLRDPVRDQLIY